jgi:tRNA-specific adenosine deaminase 1
MWSLLNDVVQLLSSISTSNGDCDRTSTVVDKCHAEGDSQENPRWEDSTKLGILRECVISSPTYEAMKQRAADAGFTQLRNKVIADVKSVLGNWVENRGDDGWGLEVLGDSRGRNVR